MTGLASTFGHLLNDPEQVLEHLDKVETELHSAPSREPDTPASMGGAGGLVFAVRKSDSGDAKPILKLASRVVEQKAVIKAYKDAGKDKKKEMWDEPALRLFSIISERYRPAPAFLGDHSLPPRALSSEQVGPQGPVWSAVTNPAQISAWARTAVRLDNSAGAQRGSGTMMADGRILTANHVIYESGWLFGHPPVKGSVARAGFNCVIGGSNVGLEISGFMEPHALDFTWIAAATQWPGALANTPFASLQALEWQKEEMEDSELQGLRVAVIGHPGPPSEYDRNLAYQIYRDGPMHTKRFMPGQLHPDQPTGIDELGHRFLRHDCSTVGGASGASVVDLASGKIIGIHVAGITEDREKDRNRAVPTWLIHRNPLG